MTDATAYVLLEDGTRFDGIACAADTHAVGEIVFTTSMSGYQEAMTDPSYAAQLIAFTYPQIGNYGVSEGAMESDRVHARAAIMRAAVDRDDAPSATQGWLRFLIEKGVPAITDVDTRALVRHIRDEGAMAGGVFPVRISEAEARALIAAEPPMRGRDLAREVTPAEPLTIRGAEVWAAAAGVEPVRIAMIDTGVKMSINAQLAQRGATVTLYPCTVSAQELLATDADAFFLANGPGDPAALDYIVDTVRELIGKRPVYGICLGHQLLCRAVGLETYKLPFGHHGANHPVKDLATGRTEITSQNHGFAVYGPTHHPGQPPTHHPGQPPAHHPGQPPAHHPGQPPARHPGQPGGAKTIDDDKPVRWQTDFGEAQLSHINLYDRTVEGLTLLDVQGATVQYHPEAGPGPHDSLYLFDRFIDEIRRGR